MKPLRLYTFSAGLALGGMLLVWLWFRQPVTLVVDGKTSSLVPEAVTVGGLLRQAGIPIRPGDRVSPSPQTWIVSLDQIRLEQAVPVEIQIDGKTTSLFTAERLPANLLLQTGLRLFGGEQLFSNGLPIDPARPLTPEAHVLQFTQAIPITLVDGKEERVIYSSASSLGQALWDAGVNLDSADRIDPPLSTLLDRPLRVSIRRAVPLTITLPGQKVALRSAASTVGEALSGAGLPLQGLDYSAPAEDQPLPANGQIRVVHVEENVLLEQKTIPFKSTYQPDPQTELDQHSVIRAGVPGIQVTRVRVRTEDGKEISRQTEGEWVARQPQTQVLGYGTQAVVHTATVDGTTIHYWRAVNAYATSYSPCNVGTGSCSDTTASGARLTKGIVAVIRSWYNQMKGQQVYIPGYGVGTIADIGGGVGGANWIDLGYDDANYVGWHQNVTIYFLTPVPASIPWILP
ncbi:MAG: ubiquitin-like domain-containing protein [Chloroflexi bacterium]|nr:ubiquitin-like domain-containing protein [Chloroflexota bacterium]